LHQRQTDISSATFDKLISSNRKGSVFSFGNGYQPPSLNGTFGRLMRDSGLLAEAEGRARTLYSLRHTYATFELLENGTDVHKLSKQMDNSATMIERHYSKLTTTMTAKNWPHSYFIKIKLFENRPSFK
jgi:integrase